MREIYDFVINKNINVHLYCLDLSWEGKQWPIVAEALSLADNVKKIKSQCSVCGIPASKTSRIVPSIELVLIGESDVYQPRCNKHFQ
jgi:thymidine kinase